MAPTRIVFETFFKTSAMVYVAVSRVADPKHLPLVGADTMVKMHGSNEPHSALGRRLFSAAVVRQLPTEGTQLPRIVVSVRTQSKLTSLHHGSDHRVPSPSTGTLEGGV